MRDMAMQREIDAQARNTVSQRVAERTEKLFKGAKRTDRKKLRRMTMKEIEESELADDL